MDMPVLSRQTRTNQSSLVSSDPVVHGTSTNCHTRTSSGIGTECHLSVDWNSVEVAVIAADLIPANVSTLPFVSQLSFKRLLNPKPVNQYLKAFVSQMGILCIDRHLDWIPLVRIARNCFEQNLIASLSHNNSAIVLKAIKTIEKGEELKVWPSSELTFRLNIPFLAPTNIINTHCYRCHECGQSFGQPNPLKIHLSLDCKPSIHPIQSLAQIRHFDRSLLTKQSNQSNQSNQSPLRQTGQTIEPIGRHKAHTCAYCGKIYTRKYGLKIHVRTHTGLKPLRCKFCGRAFSDPSNLNKHIRLHSQHSNLHSTPYKCKICPKVLVRRRDLERHLKSRHQSV